ncbi:MAG: glutamate racemase [Kiritimatiellia bacterium]|jgi:glutamate racemase
MKNTYQPQHRTEPARVLVFDSGVGGLTILQAIRQRFPQCSLFYGCDNAAFPYGNKDEGELLERVDLVVHQMQEATDADIIVVACNTASTIALPLIRQRFTMPIIGVVPAIKPAAKLSQSKVIGLLATLGTIRRDYTGHLINTFASNCEVVSLGSPELVDMAEQKLRGGTVNPALVESILAPFTHNPKIDTVVLACTHFPLLQAELQKILPDVVHWVDSGEAVARRVGHWVDELGLAEIPTSPQATTAYFTEENDDIQNLIPNLNDFGIQRVNYLEIQPAKETDRLNDPYAKSMTSF